MWAFYQDTGSRKWGRPYLTREFFDLSVSVWARQVCCSSPIAAARPIAGALNFIGPDALYGRYWGCSKKCPSSISSFVITRLSNGRSSTACSGPGRRAGRAQGRPRLRAGDYALRALHSQPSFRDAVAEFLKTNGRRCDARSNGCGGTCLTALRLRSRSGQSGRRVGHSAIHRRRGEVPGQCPRGAGSTWKALLMPSFLGHVGGRVGEGVAIGNWA